MKKMFSSIFMLGVFFIVSCTSTMDIQTPPIPTPISVESTKPPTVDPNHFLTATIVPFYTQVPSPTYEGTPAYVTIALNMGAGGAGFSATLYAQEVYTGRTIGIFMSAGTHTAPLLPTSPPLEMAVPAPGTYVFYARLTNAPTEYHYGATECQVPTECVGSPLVALEVLPGERYSILITDRQALLPGNDERGLPVTVPWVKLDETQP